MPTVVNQKPFDSAKFLTGKMAWMIRGGQTLPVSYHSPVQVGNMYSAIGKVGDGADADYVLLANTGDTNIGAILFMKSEPKTYYANVYQSGDGSLRFGTVAHETAAKAIAKAGEASLPAVATAVAVSFEL